MGEYYRVTFKVPVTYQIVIDAHGNDETYIDALWDELESNDQLLEEANERNWVDTDPTMIEVLDIEWETDDE